MAYVGQVCFCHDLLWSRPSSAMTYFGQGDFATAFNLSSLGRFWSGQADLGQRLADLGHVWSIFGGRFFVDSLPPPKKTVDFGTVDLPECQEPRRQPLTGLCFLLKKNDFFVLLCLPALFLTFGKVNGAKIDRFFFFWEEFLTFGKVNGAKIDRFFFFFFGGFLTLGKVNGAKIDRFFFFWAEGSWH